MLSYYYFALFIISSLLSIIYVFRWNKRYSIYFTVMFSIIPPSILGYWIEAIAPNMDIALIGVKLTYIGGCYCTLAVALTILYLCKFYIDQILSKIMFTISTVIFLFSLSAGHNHWFYKTVEFSQGTGLVRTYSVVHHCFIAVVFLYFAISIIAIIRGFRRPSTVSKKTVSLLFALQVISMACFFLSRILFESFDLVPASYIVGQIVFLIIADRLVLYDVDDAAISVGMSRGIVGVVFFDRKKRFLGANEAAQKTLSEIDDYMIDSTPDKANETYRYFLKLMEEVDKNDEVIVHNLTRGDRIYKISGDELRDGRRVRGYNFNIIDDTQEQEYLKLMCEYNDTLQKEVDKQTKHLVEMHDKFILGMADMVENRDGNTGGHIKRTSQGVRILMDEIVKDDAFDLSEAFVKAIIKAAPMHDIGKISVDDAVLRKPGRFTPEEFEKMKTHPAKGAEILKGLLGDLGDDYFTSIAINVANFHHERMDGSGYPMGLKGEEIPLEARIMAIADVYDALVSKRCYKEAMTFEQADKIIMEGMGPQFDKKLEKAYIAARPKLEEYYKSMAD